MLIFHGVGKPRAFFSAERYAPRIIASELHHVALPRKPQRERLNAKAADDEQIAPRLTQLLVVRALMQKISLHRAQIFRPLLLDVNECPLPPAEPKMLQTRDHQAVVRAVHYDLLSQCTPSGRGSETVTV